MKKIFRKIDDSWQFYLRVLVFSINQCWRHCMKMERRRNPRINDPLPVVVCGSSDTKDAYRFETISWDFGAGGICAFSPRILQEEEKISLYIRLSPAGSQPSQAPEVAARAIVLRSQAMPDGCCLFAASFLMRHVI
jgi:hypothetical protein